MKVYFIKKVLFILLSALMLLGLCACGGDGCADRYCQILSALKDGNTPEAQATK